MRSAPGRIGCDTWSFARQSTWDVVSQQLWEQEVAAAAAGQVFSWSDPLVEHWFEGLEDDPARDEAWGRPPPRGGCTGGEPCVEAACGHARSCGCDGQRTAAVPASGRSEWCDFQTSGSGDTGSGPQQLDLDLSLDLPVHDRDAAKRGTGGSGPYLPDDYPLGPLDDDDGDWLAGVDEEPEANLGGCAYGRARSSPDAAARGAAPSGGWTGPSFEPDLDQDPRSGGGHTQTHDDDLDGGVPLSERMAPPPFPELLGWTRHCFQLYWGVTDDYPATACEGPPITAHAGPLLPTGADLAAVRVVEQSDLWETPHPCPTEHLSPSDPRRGPMLDLVHAAYCLLWKHQDIVRWACCFPRYWSPQWSSDAPWAWQDLNPTLTSSPPGEPWDRDRVDPDGYGGWSDRGPPDLGGALVGYLDRGALDVILVDYFRQAQGMDLDPQSRAPMGDCEKDGAAGGAVNLIEAFDAPFERAVVLPLGSSSWVAWLDLWSNATTDSERGCAALRAASTILHELVHSEAMEWSHHLYNHCLDPCVMVQSAWYHGMALRFPELRAASCCNGITQPMHFMDTVKRGQPCY